jgi:3-hydroxyacyl-[acyl-carrier-protein] dehydratase
VLIHETTLHVAASHPSLEGHFPGRPIVPGVVLLDCVLAEVQRWQRRSLRVIGLPQVKFIAPLLPEERAQLQLRLDEQELRFTVLRGTDLIAQGLFQLAPERDP